MKKLIALFLLFMTVACAQKFATDADLKANEAKTDVMYRNMLTDIFTTFDFTDTGAWTEEDWYVGTTAIAVYGLKTGGVVYQTELDDNSTYELTIDLNSLTTVSLEVGTGNSYGDIFSSTSTTLDTVITFNTADLTNRYLAIRPNVTGIPQSVAFDTLQLRKLGIPHSKGLFGGGEYHLSEAQYEGILDLLAGVAIDTIPDPSFAFTDTTGVVEGRVYLSDWVSLTGYDSATASISGGLYRTGLLDTWHSADSVISYDSIQVKGTASSSQSTTTHVVLTVGGLTDTYSITTRATKFIYFSSTEGNDSYDGLDSANAKASISSIEDYTDVPAGTRFKLQRGSVFTDTSQATLGYPEDSTRMLSVPRSNVVIEDYGVGLKPILDCGGLKTNGLFISKDSVSIYNLKIVDQMQWDSSKPGSVTPAHYTYRLLHVWDVDNFLLDSVDLDAEAAGYIHQASQAYIGYGSKNGTIRYCTIENSYEHGIYFGRADSMTIEYNTIQDNSGAGMVENTSSIWAKGWIIRYNTFRNNQRYVALRSYGTEDLEFYYNLVIFPSDSVGSLAGDDNWDDYDKAVTYGIQFTAPTADDLGVKNAKVYNNTFVIHVDHVGGLDAAFQIADGTTGGTDTVSAEIFNNIFYKIHSDGYFYMIYNNAAANFWDLNFHNNVYYMATGSLYREWKFTQPFGSGVTNWTTLPDWQDRTGGFQATLVPGSGVTTDDNSIYQNPLFTSFSDDVTATGTNDYSLQSGSPARNMGYAHSIVIDFVGNTVPDISAELFDVGAYEYTP